MKPRYSSLPILCILLIAFAIRLYDLSVQSFWYDEIVTINYILQLHLDPLRTDGRLLMHVLLSAPSGLLIPNEFGFRFPSVIAGVLTTAMFYKVGSRIGGRPTGLIAALMIATSPIFVYYSQEARAYSLVGAFTALTLLLILSNRPLNWAYPISVGILAMLHLYSAPFIAAQIAFLAALKLRSHTNLSWRILIAASISTLIGLGIVLSLEQAQGSLEIPYLPLMSPSFILPNLFGNAIGLQFREFSELPYPLVLALISLISIVFLIGLWRWLRQADQWWPILMLTTLAILPVLALVAFSYLISPIYQVRYVLPSLIALVALLAGSLVTLRPRYLSATALIVIIGGSVMLSTALFHNPTYQRMNWRAAIAYVEEHRQPGDRVYLCTGFAAVPVLYYAPDLEFEVVGHTESPSLTPYFAPPIIPDEVQRAWILGVGDFCIFGANGSIAPHLTEISAESFNEARVRLYIRNRE